MPGQPVAHATPLEGQQLGSQLWVQAPKGCLDFCVSGAWRGSSPAAKLMGIWMGTGRIEILERDWKERLMTVMAANACLQGDSMRTMTA